MPRATVSMTPQRFELESCSGAYVVIKRMSYGFMLYRQQEAIRNSMSDGDGSPELVMQAMQKRVAEVEFKNCIVEHNLDDENDVRLDFSNPSSLDKLDPAIGEEIAKRIDEVNNSKKNGLEEEMKTGNLPTASTES
jgi:hypothetical protein